MAIGSGAITGGSGAAMAGVAALVGALAVAAAWARRGDRRLAALDGIAGAERPHGAVPPWFEAAVGRLGLPLDAGPLWRPARVAGPVVVVLLVVHEPRLVVAATVVGIAWAVRSRWTSRRTGSVDAVAVVEALVAQLSAGASLAQAVADVAGRGAGTPASVALAPVARSIEEGATAQASFDRWVDDVDDRRLRLVADALAVAGTSGGSQTVALIGVGRTLRERDALAREVRALGSQARTSAAVLAATPVAFTSVVALLDGRVAAFLCTTPVGVLCLVAGAGCDAVGWWWMRRMVEAVS